MNTPNRNLTFTVASIAVILVLSAPSLAGVVDAIQAELNDLIGSDSGVPDTSSEKETSSKVSKVSTSSSYSPSSDAGQQSSSPTTEIPAVSRKESTSEKDLYDDLSRYTGYYNNGIDEVPDLVKKVAGNDVIVLDIDMKDNSKLQIKAVTKDGMITEFREISSTKGIDPSVTVSGDEDAIRAILSGNDPMGELSASLNSGELDIECDGFLKKAAVAALKAAA